MPGGLDEAAAIISVVDLCVRLFEGTIKGLILLKKARGFPSELASVNLLIDIQLLHLDTWAKAVGLCQDPPTLWMDLSYAQVVSATLTHLQTLATDLDVLRRDYGLKLERTRESLPATSSSAQSVETTGIPTDEELKHELKDTIGRVLRKRREPWRALKWVAYDAQRMQGLVDRFARLVDELYKMLDRPKQAQVAKLVEMVERRVVLKSADEQDLHTIGFQAGATERTRRVAAAANLRIQGLKLGILDSNSIDRKLPSMKQMRLSAEALSSSNSDAQGCRYITHYQERPVLVEFKTDSSLKDDLLRDRVRKVSAFLSDLDPSFHGLKCKGYLKLRDRFAYVFEIPDLCPSQGPLFCRSLRQVLDDLPAPSLNVRVAIAITLLETALQLHTSGWLHKEIRSESILFIDRQTHEQVGESIFAAPVYIAGYSLARNDDPQEATEPLVSEVEADLYRHPRSLGPCRESYHKSFDIFSVGCVLLELGLWCSLPALLRGQPDHLRTLDEDGRPDLLASRRSVLFCASSTDRKTAHQIRSPSRLSQDVSNRLEASMGETYTSIVTQAFVKAESERQVGDKAILNFEMEALEQLRMLNDVL